MQTIPSQQNTSSCESKPYKLEDWQGANCSLNQEYDYWIEDVEGEIPTNLNGTLFRNGPGLLDIFGREIHHPFDGDGMICAVSFDLRKKNVANTNIIYWGDKLLALWEASHPYRLDPNTLETLGIETLDGVLHKDSPFAAHPMIDPGDETREPRLVTFAIKPGPLTTITVYELNQTGKVVQQHDHKIPGFAFIHGFAITPNYCLFFQNPVSFNPLPYVLGFRGAAECIKFHRRSPTKIWLIPRDSSREVQVLETDPCFVFHHANAFEEGDELIVDSVCYETFPGIDHNLNYQEIDFDTRPPAQLWRFHLNLKTKTAQRDLLVERSCEFPFIHPDRIGQPHRCIFLAAAHQPQGDAPQQAIIKVDPEYGEQEFWSAAPKGFVGEPVFVPRTPHIPPYQGGIWGGEDDGWVLTLVFIAPDIIFRLIYHYPNP